MAAIPASLSTPVLIVGGGPIGLALAADLGRRGVAALLIEKSDDRRAPDVRRLARGPLAAHVARRAGVRAAPLGHDRAGQLRGRVAGRAHPGRLAGRPEGDLPAPRMTLHLFAGLRVRDFKAAQRWYEQLLGEPTFFPHATEAVWTLAEDRSVYVVEQAEGAGNSVVTIFVDDLDAQIAEIDARGLHTVST